MSIPRPKYKGEYIGKTVIVTKAIIEEDQPHLNNIYIIKQTHVDGNNNFIMVEGIEMTFECNNFDFCDEGTLVQYAKRRKME